MSLWWLFGLLCAMESGKDVKVPVLRAKRSSKYTAYARLAGGPKYSYLNAFYQLLYSLEGITLALENMPLRSQPSAANELIQRVQKAIRILRNPDANPQVLPLLDDALMEALIHRPATSKLSPAQFVEAFVRLVRKAWIEAGRKDYEVKKLLVGLWEKDDTLSAALEWQINPVVVSMGRHSLKEALAQHFAGVKNNSSTSSKQVGMEIAPRYLFICLEWDGLVQNDSSKLLPFFSLRWFTQKGLAINYFAQALIYKNDESEKYMTITKRRKSWMEFIDEMHAEITVTNDISTSIEREGKIWRCVMVVYQSHHNVALKTFDISKGIKQNMLRNSAEKAEKDIRAKEEFYKHFETLKIEKTNSVDSSSSKRKRDPSPSAVSSLSESLALCALSKQKKRKVKSFIILPRIESLQSFSEDVCCIQETERDALCAAILVQSYKVNDGLSPNKIFSQFDQSKEKMSHFWRKYRDFSFRLMLSHRASLIAAKYPLLYVKALLCACEAVDDIYPADRSFFTSAHNNLLRLSVRLFSAPFSERQLFIQLIDELGEKARKKGLLSEIVLAAAHNYNPQLRLYNVEFIEELLANPLFQEAKNLLNYIDRLDFKDTLPSFLKQELKEMRQAYLDNNYTV